MRLSGGIAGFLLIPLLGMTSCGYVNQVSASNAERLAHHNRFAAERQAGERALQAGEYPRAIEEFVRGAEAANRAGDWFAAGRFLSNASAAYMMRGENRKAIQTLLQARQAAERTPDLLTLQSIQANLATIYVLTGDYEAAAAAAGRGAQIRPEQQAPAQRIRVLMSFGRAMAKTGALDAAARLFEEAAGLASTQSQEADVLELWGYELGEADARHGEQAEELLTLAWYKRRLSHDKRLPLTEGKLARLCRKRGETAAARRWMNRSLAAVERGERLPVQGWVMRAEDAHIASDEGRLQESLTIYRQALVEVKRWRDALPAQDRLRLRAEQRMVEEIFEGYLEAAGRLYRLQPSETLATEMFQLIQRTRAWSLEDGEAASLDNQVLYAEARRLESRWLAGDAAAKAPLKLLRAAILDQEAAAVRAGRKARKQEMEAPEPGSAILTFWLHPEGSWLWVWKADGLVQTPLGPRDRILAAVERFRRAVEENKAEAPEIGLALRHQLLGDQEAACLRVQRWDVVVDDGLFHVPFGALPGSSENYLVEQMEIRLIPNALKSTAPASGRKRFLAVADPIFNEADSRRKSGWRWPFAVKAADTALTLPRLPGTRREAEAAGRAWSGAGYETAVETGEESGEEPVLKRLRTWEPRIVHIATHTITANGGGPAPEDRSPRLALSMRTDGTPGILTAEDIAAIPLRAELIVMSACQSAGEAAAAGGILGLTRAWLTAGARNVISTLWPVGDESTAFFSEFYEQLAKGQSGDPLAVGAALRQAQIACLRNGGVSAEPRNWAGHLLLARR